MKLEDQCCSLELAKKLKELGVKQESLCFWTRTHSSNSYEADFKIHGPYQTADPEPYLSAFTVAELELLLPNDVNIAYKNGKPRERGHYRIMRRITNGDYNVAYRHRNYSSDSWIDVRAATFADTLAKMLIYLIANKLTDLT